mmetsp:Transcript_33074/g.71484  ORF Transcript_33074/g.71484 Transcript_33074/m.71484 type:complete len:162 (+) Transcript_33074:76-561(+)
MSSQQSVRRRDNSSTAACGYVTFLLSNAFIILYFLWALLPSHIVENIDEHYTTYYPPRQLAGYIPAYVALIFVFGPILYMGLNMLSCPKDDSIHGIWDTRSNAVFNNNMASSMCADLCSEGSMENECNNFNISNEIDSLPSICDVDVKLINLRIRQGLNTN